MINCGLRLIDAMKRSEADMNRWYKDPEGCHRLKVEDKEAMLIPTTLGQWQAVIYAGSEKIEREGACDRTTAKRWAIRQLAPPQKPGPKTRKGERRPFLLYLPLDVWEALDRVAQPEPGYTAFIEAAVREKLEKLTYWKS